MQIFDVPTMTCGHCVSTITRAIQALDPAAKVQADLGSRTVAVTASVTTARLSAAIADAGYQNTPQA